MRKKSLLLALSLDSWPAQFCTNGIRGFFSANVTRLELGSEYVPNRNLSHCMPAVVLGHLNFYAICLTVTLFPEKYLEITDAMTAMSLESFDCCLEYPGRSKGPVKESVAGVADPVWTWVTSEPRQAAWSGWALVSLGTNGFCQAQITRDASLGLFCGDPMGIMNWYELFHVALAFHKMFDLVDLFDLQAEPSLQSEAAGPGPKWSKCNASLAPSLVNVDQTWINVGPAAEAAEAAEAKRLWLIRTSDEFRVMGLWLQFWHILASQHSADNVPTVEQTVSLLCHALGLQRMRRANA